MLLPHVCTQQLVRVAYTVHVRALVVMARVHAGTDETVANVIARAKRSLHVGSVMWVDVDGVAEVQALGRIGKRAHQLVIVRATRILGADGDHALSTAQIVAHTAHIHADHLARVCRHEGAAMADLLVHREEQGHLARELNVPRSDRASQAQ